VNWLAVCRPTSLGGLGILNMEKFARALRLRWPWLAWNSSDRPWVGMENPCNKDDMELFYGLTSITIGNGNKASFWVDYWVDGISPKVLAPSIYAISRQKTSSVRKAITDDAWVRHLDNSAGLSIQHLQEFTTLWGHTSQLILHDDTRTPLLGCSLAMKSTCVPWTTKGNLRGLFALIWTT
jgi:hypothetical protein